MNKWQEETERERRKVTLSIWLPNVVSLCCCCCCSSIRYFSRISRSLFRSSYSPFAFASFSYEQNRGFSTCLLSQLLLMPFSWLACSWSYRGSNSCSSSSSKGCNKEQKQNIESLLFFWTCDGFIEANEFCLPAALSISLSRQQERERSILMAHWLTGRLVF